MSWRPDWIKLRGAWFHNHLRATGLEAYEAGADAGIKAVIQSLFGKGKPIVIAKLPGGINHAIVDKNKLLQWWQAFIGEE